MSFLTEINGVKITALVEKIDGTPPRVTAEEQGSPKKTITYAHEYKVRTWTSLSQEGLKCHETSLSKLGCDWPCSSTVVCLQTVNAILSIINSTKFKYSKLYKLYGWASYNTCRILTFACQYLYEFLIQFT